MTGFEGREAHKEEQKRREERKVTRREEKHITREQKQTCEDEKRETNKKGRDHEEGHEAEGLKEDDMHDRTKVPTTPKLHSDRVRDNGDGRRRRRRYSSGTETAPLTCDSGPHT